MNLKLYWPLSEIRVTQYFGENQTPLYKQLGLLGHTGIDLVAPDGTPVLASHDGIVTFTGEDGSGGLGVVIRTLEAFAYKDGPSFYKTIYWHLAKNSFKVKPGDTVQAGQTIALADNTGASTGSHLHFGLKPIAQGEQDWQWDNIEQNNGYKGAIDPLPYITGYPPTATKFMFTKDLRFGNTSDDVKQLQIKLKLLGFYLYPDITSYYGDYTRDAVLQFQLVNRVDNPVVLYFLNGNRVGPKTRAKLNSV